jgi:hypothetical protein
MDTLVFYKNSAHKPAGHGAHEMVQDPIIYEALNKIPNWRRILCSQWSEESFRYDKYSFRSVDQKENEHRTRSMFIFPRRDNNMQSLLFVIILN